MKIYQPYYVESLDEPMVVQIALAERLGMSPENIKLIRVEEATAYGDPLLVFGVKMEEKPQEMANGLPTSDKLD